VPALKLVAFDSCQQLRDDLRAAAKQSVGPWGLPGNNQGVPEAATMARDARGMAPNAAAVGAAPAPDVPYSGTNVHEQGADEPDIVKTDGRRIVTVGQGVLRVIDPATHTQTGRLSLGPAATGATDLLLAGDRALVLVRGTYLAARMRVMLPPGDLSAQVLLVDLAGTPRVISRYQTDGTLVDARQTGTVARVVLSTTPRIKFPFTATSDNALLKQNQKAIGAAPVDAWLPSWQVTTGTTTSKGRVDCSAVSRPSTYSGAGMLTVLTFDLAAPALTDGSPVTVVADGETVYGTPDSLYIANNQRWRFTATPTDRARPRLDTEIYKFALPPTGKPTYASGGSVPGVLLNQYSMSEWDGHLRVATTDPSTNASAVRILRDSGGKLAEVGEVGGLGKGEQIYSVRFLGPRGYVVTFRQTDPLYSLDLADPAAPRVTGALKITGYSAHLQPAGDDRLIGIGQEADEQGIRQGLQVSLFDVADPAQPRRLAQEVLPQSNSEAEWDPHAILWWPATRLLVLPVSGPTGSGAVALKVTDSGIQTATDLDVPVDSGAPVRRALVIGDELWTLSDYGLLASNLTTLDRTGWVPLR